MVKILKKEVMSVNVSLYVLETPDIAAKARPGQFVIIRVHDKGERVPLTIADFDRKAGTITIVVQEIGASTKKMSVKNAGDSIAGVVGPLGMPTHIEKKGTVVCIGGGIGIACIYPIARGFHEAGNNVIGIIGARNKDYVIFEDRMRAVCKDLHITTDDGSYGKKGFVTTVLKELIDSKMHIDQVFAVGPAVMMAAVSEVTKTAKVPTFVSLNPIMVDGTGMCGGCRVTVGGQTKFACVDGPDFDAHQVDFKELLQRQGAYKRDESCHLDKVIKEQG
ncbi:MAG: sulfide/dihydroorotate dehydrogenase-like FAD/NAD-binding protein [Candidatus Omnitrophica bacterium]|nr:sulfide/dihydroorotate dehydrogenase-like FAD/NAD-binding protein [Candidatus Omnitrophota bacterium]